MSLSKPALVPPHDPQRVARPTLRPAGAVGLLWDVLCWIGALGLWTVSRYEVSLQPAQTRATLIYLAMVITIQLLVGLASKFYRGRHRSGSFEEATGLALLVGIAAVTAGTMGLAVVGNLPIGTAIAVPPLALVAMAAGRWSYREWTTRSAVPADGAPKVLIYGAGESCVQLLNQLTHRPPYEVVGLLDDDPAKRHLRIAGARVLGSRADLIDIVNEYGVSMVILAITTADAQFVSKLSEDADRAGVRLVILPPLHEIIDGKVRLDQLHDVSIDDLLGRRPVSTDLSEIMKIVGGRRVLVTGAGGSIGSELARQLSRFGPEKLIMLDRDESALHSVQLSIYGQGLLDTDDMVLCDIRDLDALDKVFAHHQPHVVLHAAALKHLPMLEQYPDEGWKTNVLGTLNVLTCASHHGVERFVNISTDKAADPSSVLGRTKRVAEQLTAWFAREKSGSYLSVRFGNVLGSRGSMLHTFRTQIDMGGPITVTHPDVTRYFMTIPEACQLTLQAAAIGEPGNVLVLDMGQPVSILAVAERLIASSGRKIEIRFTGLREGEKLHEVLFSENEAGSLSVHPLIRQVPVPPIDPSSPEISRSPLSLDAGWVDAEAETGRTS